MDTQDTPVMFAEAQRQHHWLQQLVGDWTYEAEGFEPGKPPQRATGSESVRALGDLWFVAEGQGEMPGGGAASTVLTLGYDPDAGHFVGTWIGSIMTHMWVYEGSLDSNEKVLTLETEGPVFGVEGKFTKYREVIELKSEDERTFTSQMLNDDGAWVTVMTANYRRRK